MKKLTEYITEALKADVQKWFKQVYQTMQSLVKDNKVQPIEVDTKKLAKPKNGGFKFDDFANDKTFKTIVDDKSLGFAVTSQILKNPNKYLIDKSGENEKELKPECIPYWYQQDKNVYFVGIVMYDPSVSYIDEFAHLVDIETSLCVSESTPVLKAILNDFALHYLNKKGNYKGLTAKPEHPKMRAILTKLGFNSFKDNKDILTYKL